jgi:hypothetical protein
MITLLEAAVFKFLFFTAFENIFKFPIRRRDRMRIGMVAFRSAKSQVADMMRCASARFVERDFDPGLTQRVLWSNFRSLHSQFFQTRILLKLSTCLVLVKL